ncbi:IPIL1 protein, partial [Crotophaga sulcirostris]|nr:IPIL1 protein [Crotophaga sulcirostris]
AEDLVLSFIQNIRKKSSNSFFPVLQAPIGVGSAFEGWSSSKDGPVYRFLVPLKPPCGHAFHLEPSTAGEMPPRTFRIRMELVCTCTTEQQVEKVRCFLHQSEEEPWGNQAFRHLHPLCTGSYLDVKRTARWLNQNVKAVWKAVPQLVQCCPTVLPSSCSCKFQVVKGGEKILTIEMIFGVQLGNSDVFLSSQPAEATFTRSTMWTESYAVAEVKFFRHMTWALPNNCHLKCLQACAHLLTSRSFSTYTFKTVVMHLLTTTIFSSQNSSNLLQQLECIILYLHYCLKEKCLNHFFIGNENMLEEIVLAAGQMSEPLNLFQHFAQNPFAYAQACREFKQL